MKRLLPCLLVLALLCPLGGCWDHLAINKMLIIAGIGLDATDDERWFHATLEIVNIEAEGGKNIAAERVEGWGETIHAAIQDATKMNGGVLFGNHCKVIVLGDSLARSGISRVLETVLRSPQYRKTVDLFVARDSTAADILTGKTVSNDIISYELAAIAKSNAENLRNTIPTGVYELHESLVSPCSYSVVPAVTTRQNGEERVLVVDGCAVFTGDRLQGYLQSEESQLLSLLLRGINDVTVRLDEPSVASRPIDLRLDSGRVSLRPNLQDDALSLHVDITAEGSLRDAVLNGLDLSSDTATHAVEQAAARHLSAKLARLIGRVQSDYGADIFEFHNAFQNKYRRQWGGLSPDWDAHFRTLSVTVACQVHLTGSGLIGNYTPHNSSTEGGNALP